MNKQDTAHTHAESMKAGIFAAIMMVSFCFTIAITMSGSAPAAASSQLETAERQP